MIWRRHWPPLIMGGVMLLSVTGLMATSSYPPLLMLRHIAAAPNCTAARAVGLAPAYRGEPGYYAQHDRDNDGWACEPWPRLPSWDNGNGLRPDL